MVAPPAKKACVMHLIEKHALSERHACLLVGANRTTVRYRSHRASEEELKEQIMKIAMKHRRFGYRRIHLLLKRAGKGFNHKRIYRLYKILGVGNSSLRVVDDKEKPVVARFRIVLVEFLFDGVRQRFLHLISEGRDSSSVLDDCSNAR